MLSSLRNFLLALIISLAVCGTGSYFLVGYVRDTIAGGFFKPPETSEVPGEEDTPTIEAEEDYTSFTVLILGIDDGESQRDDTKKEADTIFLVNINSKTKKIMVSPLTCDMRVQTKGYAMRLGAVYSDYGIETLLNVVWSRTKIKPDYYCVFNYESIEALFEIWGEVEYDVPMDMYYMPKLYDEENFLKEQALLPEEERTEREPEIDLKSGMQEISGEQAVQLLRYKNYSNGNEGRISIQIDFINEVLRQKITFENLKLAKEIFTAAKSGVADTNVDEKTFENYKELIFSLSTDYEIKRVDYPGDFRNEHGINFYIPNLQEALKIYSEYNEPSRLGITSTPPLSPAETAETTE